MYDQAEYNDLAKGDMSVQRRLSLDNQNDRSCHLFLQIELNVGATLQKGDVDRSTCCLLPG